MNFKLSFITSLIVSFLTVFSVQSKSIRVLYIGNSYIYTNDIPAMVKEMASTTGNQIHYESNTPGGSTLKQHSTNATTINLIKKGDWDFIVLQDQSQYPSFPIGQVQADVFPYAEQLSNLAKQFNPCVKVVFYVTWGRKNGDSQNCPVYPPVCTYEGMDDLLYERYTYMAEANNAVLAPVGPLWRKMREANVSFNLYSSDESHPSVHGAYAAAATFYSIFFRKNPSLITYNASLSATDASVIKSAAETHVHNQESYWYRFTDRPYATFTTLTTGAEVVFTNASLGASSFNWNFGDGSTSTNVNPTHVYTQNGTYEVRLIAGESCQDTLIKSLQMNFLGLDNATSLIASVFPNPVVDQLTIQTNSVMNEVRIVSVLGEVQAVCYPKNSVAKLRVEHLSKGIYHLVIVDQVGTIVRTSFVK